MEEEKEDEFANQGKETEGRRFKRIAGRGREQQPERKKIQSKMNGI